GVYQVAGSGSSTTLAGVAGSPFATGGSFTDALAQTASGTVLIAANGSSRNLTVFGVSQSTGALTSLLLQAANTLGTGGRITGVGVPAAGRRHQVGSRGGRRFRRRREGRRGLAQQGDRPEHRLADERVDGLELGVPADDRRHELGDQSRRRSRRRRQG